VVWSCAKLFFISAKFKMAANTTSVKELNVLKQCSNTLNITVQVRRKIYDLRWAE
jgi:hypothetical protein